ncbi:MAG: hypothetical protein EBQ51_04285 [Verrucomicrobia bacterium]|nr:hypothetical protein [Verrucomicrobiota bacterium]NBS79465.1 hypothetical protein [bacterium]NBS49560.1 hypothetical protein [Verrucomicrobiota bacterium]NBT23332.1 hypothetical protein [bacterium]NBV96186.1 hypothetical protein [Verrucomicrobiota bacterium]
MGEKNQNRAGGHPAKRPPLPRPTKVGSSSPTLLIPAALFFGFLLGTYFGRPLFFSAPTDSTGETPAPESPLVTSSNSPKGSPQASKTASPAKMETKWDEKTIRTLSLAEIRSRLAELGTWTPGPLADQTERWLVQRWAALEPQAACQYAYTAALQGADESMLMEALALWTKASPAAAARWAGNLGSPSLRDLSIRTVYSTWAKIDSAAAAQSISSLRPASARGIASAATAPPHAGKNFATAMQWARALPGPLREKTLDAILGEWTRRDPPGAAGWLIQQPGDIQWALISKLAADWVRKDPASALSWGLGQSTEVTLGSKLAVGPVQRKFFESALGALIGADPQGAANWLASPVGEPFFATRIGSVAGRWTSMDPLEAATWSLSLPKESDRNSAIGAVAGTWARTDPQAAGQWIRTLADPKLRDNALSAYCGSISPYDAGTAAQVAVEITSPSKRNSTVISAVKRWMQYDPAAAREFILGTPALDQATKENLLR